MGESGLYKPQQGKGRTAQEARPAYPSLGSLQARESNPAGRYHHGECGGNTAVGPVGCCRASNTRAKRRGLQEIYRRHEVAWIYI